jgi:hypothetical protein
VVRVPDGRFAVENARAALFRPHVNATFTVTAGSCRTSMVLARVDERPVTRGVEQFSLIFHAPAGAVIPEGTHAFHHPALGSLPLFVVPVGIPNSRRSIYQACFSRRVA